MSVARNPHEVRSQLASDCFNPPPGGLDKKKQGAVIGRLGAVFGGDSGRHLALAWLFDYLGKATPDNPDKIVTGLSTKSLSDGEWYALWLWIGFYKDEETGEWRTRPEFPLEASLCMNEALKAYNKLELGTRMEDRSWEGSMVRDAVTQLGGVVTNVSPDGENWWPHEGVEMPPDYPPKKKRMFPEIPKADF